MTRKILSLLVISITFFLPKAFSIEPPKSNEYNIIVEGFDWGPAVNKVILSIGEPVSATDWKNYKVLVNRSSNCSTIPVGQSLGERSVIGAYASNEKGIRTTEGNYLTLVLGVSPNDPLSSPIQYSRGEKCSGNNWIDYKLTVRDESHGREWNKEVGRIIPLIDEFDLTGKYSESGITMSYASFNPKVNTGKSPLIIWLHGGGEGGTDASIPLIANRAANYASEEIQSFFGGAYVLAPQSPTRWMDSGEGSTSGKVDDIYFKAVMGLIQNYIKANPTIDRNRIYVGGCSNGGYLAFKLLLEYPDFFAAAFPSSLAYQGQYLTDKHIKAIKNIPIWFIQSKDDKTTVPDETVVPVYKRLIAGGATNVHFTFYDHVVDITGFFGGDDYLYNGHWSWIYSHANKARKDYDGNLVMLNGRSVTIMEWLAAQKKK